MIALKIELKVAGANTLCASAVREATICNLHSEDVVEARKYKPVTGARRKRKDDGRITVAKYQKARDLVRRPCSPNVSWTAQSESRGEADNGEEGEVREERER